MAFYRRLQKAAMGDGSRVFARDDKMFPLDDKNRDCADMSTSSGRIEWVWGHVLPKGEVSM